MKRKASSLTLILLLISAVTGAKLVSLAEANTQEPQSQIITFEEAIEAANTGDDPEQWLIMFWISGKPKGDLLVDGSGVSGFLMWLAPNGTFYEAEYPSGRVMGEIGHTTDQDDWTWNATDASYIWRLYYPHSEEYNLFANNGTIIGHIHATPKGPVPPPSPISQEILFGIAAVLWAVIGVILLFYLRKRKE